MNREDIIRMAREAGCLGPGNGGDPNGLWEPNGHENVTALMVRFAALVAAAARAEPVQEPVAWTTMPDAEDWLFISGSDDPNGRLQGEWTPLYTSPPQLKPLTDEEMKRVCVEAWSFDPYEIARAIERAHGIGDNT